MATRLRQANLKPKKEEATVNKKLKTIDHSMKTITVSKDFLQKAGQFGTPEFREALLMKEDFPDYTLVERKIKRNPQKRTYGNLTYEQMESFIMGREAGKDAALEEFEMIRKWAKTQNAAYSKVKKWFLDKYKEDFEKAQEEQGR